MVLDLNTDQVSYAGLLKMDHENPEIKKLYRAFSMYEEAFEVFLMNVYGARICKRHTSTTLAFAEVSEVNGVLLVDLTSKQPLIYGMLIRATRRAMLMHMRCEMPAGECWPL